MNLPGINIVVIAAILIGTGTLLAADAQTDTRQATFPPDADKVLVWHSGSFEISCTNTPDYTKRIAAFEHYSSDPDHGDEIGYFIADHRDPDDLESAGTFKFTNLYTGSPRFHILATEVNNTTWQSYGVMYGGAICSEGGDSIIDFTLTGTCDGSNIYLETSEPLIEAIQKNGTNPSANYHAWCGYIPDDLDRLNNKIF